LVQVKHESSGREYLADLLGVSGAQLRVVPGLIGTRLDTLAARARAHGEAAKACCLFNPLPRKPLHQFVGDGHRPFLSERITPALVTTRPAVVSAESPGYPYILSFRMDQSRLDLVIQYTLAVAEPPLTATQLLKYAYLADLAYATLHDGETFTGAPWVFLYYGPYSKDVHQRVPDAARAIGAEAARKQRAEDGTEYLSFKIGDDPHLAEKLRDLLPSEVASAVRWKVKEHGADTAALLEEVYRTEPMLHAAPGERLDFTTEPRPMPKYAISRTEESIVAESATSDVTSESPTLGARFKAAWKTRREEKAARERIAAELHRRSEAKSERRDVATGPAPRYDDVYNEGVKVLDSLAGDEVPEGEYQVTFSEDVWKSPSRRGSDGSS
jgi:hypothetical protein